MANAQTDQSTTKQRVDGSVSFLKSARAVASAAALSLMIALSGCSTAGLEFSEPELARDVGGGFNRDKGSANPPSLFDGDIFSAGDDDEADGDRLPVNRYIWRATLDTLAFLPLASTDPYTGVITTDWGGAAETPGERVKVTAFITSAELSPNSLRVSVNRQVLSDSGWVDAPVSPETARALENAILTRARQLRAASGDE